MLSSARSLKYELFGAWCAPIFSVLTIVGFLGLSHFYDPAAAHLAPRDLNHFYEQRQFGVEFGMSLFCVATAFLAIFSVQLGVWLWRFEGRSPVMAIGQMLGGFGVVMLIFISCCLWIGAAYRSDSSSPEIAQALNDAAWFGFLIGWVMLALQMATTAAITVMDRRSEPLVPRWVSIASIVGCVLLVMANGCALTKTGPFAWDGILGYYVPMAIWGSWLDGHAWIMRKEIRKRMAAADAGETVVTPHLGMPAEDAPQSAVPTAAR